MGKQSSGFRAAVSGGYRFFTDDWGIDGHTVDVGYVQPWRDRWMIDIRYRYYSQNSADFFSDLFPYEDAQNYLARISELSGVPVCQVSVGPEREQVVDV